MERYTTEKGIDPEKTGQIKVVEFYVYDNELLERVSSFYKNPSEAKALASFLNTQNNGFI